MQLTVSDWPEGFASVGFDSVLANKGQLGTGLEIRDNIVAHNRGRGLLIKAGGGTVSGNTIVNPAWWGIMVRPAVTPPCHYPALSSHLSIFLRRFTAQWSFSTGSVFQNSMGPAGHARDGVAGGRLGQQSEHQREHSGRQFWRHLCRPHPPQQSRVRPVPEPCQRVHRGQHGGQRQLCAHHGHVLARRPHWQQHHQGLPLPAATVRPGLHVRHASLDQAIALFCADGSIASCAGWSKESKQPGEVASG